MGEILAPRDPMVHVADLTKVYQSKRGAVQALTSVSLDVFPEEFVSIIGPSGCGKSTLLKIVAGLDTYNEGTLEWQWERTAHKGQDIGFVFQEPVLLPWKSVLDNACFPLDLFGRPRAQSELIVRTLLQQVGLSGFEKALPRELSGGMRQRVAIVRALAYDPRLLLMDEPFGALDMLTREQLNDQLLRLWSGSPKAVLFVTHSVDEAVYLSDRVVVMSQRPGTIREVIPIELQRPREPQLRENPDFMRYVQRLRQALTAVEVPS